MIDVAKKQCRFEMRTLKIGARVPCIVRKLEDGSTRIVPFTPRRLEGRVHREVAEAILQKLEIDPSDFFAD